MKQFKPIKNESKLFEFINFLYKNNYWREFLITFLVVETGLKLSQLIKLKVKDLLVMSEYKAEDYCLFTPYQKHYPQLNDKYNITEKLIVDSILVNGVAVEIDNRLKYTILDYLDSYLLYKHDLEQFTGNEYLLYTQKGKSINRDTINRLFIKSTKKVNVSFKDINYTILRKTFGYFSYTKGFKTLIELKKIFNHSTAKFTKSYIDV